MTENSEPKTGTSGISLPKNDIIWRQVSTDGRREIFALLFSERFRLELIYDRESRSAEVFLADKTKKGDSTVYSAKSDGVHGVLHAQQWAGFHVANLMHNVAADCKNIEIALTATKGWRDLAAQNL